MQKDSKSPQEKKRLDYTKGHFTFGRQSSRSFPKTWKRKKVHANREYRRKSEELLAQSKPGSGLDGLPPSAEDLTAARFLKSVVRKPLHKAGTVTLEEKVRLKLTSRGQRAGRGVKKQAAASEEATSVIQTLNKLEGDRLVDFVRRANVLCNIRDPKESVRLQLSADPIDQALDFVYRLSVGTNSPRDTICKDEQLRRPLAAWFVKANRILSRDERKAQNKVEEKQRNEKRLKTRRRAAEGTA